MGSTYTIGQLAKAAGIPTSTLRYYERAGSDVRTFLALRASDMTLCKDVQPLIAKRVQDVSARIQEMQQVLTVLQAFLAQCHAQAQDDTCHVLAALAPSVS